MKMTRDVVEVLHTNEKLRQAVMNNMSGELYGMCAILGTKALADETASGRLPDDVVEVVGTAMASAIFYREKMVETGRASERNFEKILETYKSPMTLNKESANSATKKYITACQQFFDKVVASTKTKK